MQHSHKLPTGPLDFCLSLVRASAAVTRKLDGRLGSLHGLSFADFAILKQIAAAPDMRMRRVDLADALGLTSSGVTRALIPLEKIGLVSRQTDKRDARVGYATLTAAGRRLLTDAVETALEASRDLLEERDFGAELSKPVR
jgi:DNA-binding MarR family transcriptional regulator